MGAMRKRYSIPQEPATPVIDKDGIVWTRDECGLWHCEGFLPQMWTSLLRFRGDVWDVEDNE